MDATDLKLTRRVRFICRATPPSLRSSSPFGDSSDAAWLRAVSPAKDPGAAPFSGAAQAPHGFASRAFHLRTIRAALLIAFCFDGPLAAAAESPMAPALGQMTAAMTDTLFLLEAARAQKKSTIVECIVQVVRQMTARVELARGLESQLLRATRQLNGGPEAEARLRSSIEQHAATVHKLAGKASSCADGQLQPASTDARVEVAVETTTNDVLLPYWLGGLTGMAPPSDTRPPPASPYQ